jgi:hypothetical protein
MVMNWKGFGRKLSRHSPGGIEEKYEKLNQDNRSPEPRFEPRTSTI